MSREVLFLINSPTESATIWQEAFSHLKERGVKEVGIIVSDGLSGIENAVQAVFPSSDQQLCTVHLKRGIINKVKQSDIERLNRNYKRVVKMRAALPSPESVLLLLGSVAREQKAYDYPITFSITRQNYSESKTQKTMFATDKKTQAQSISKNDTFQVSLIHTFLGHYRRILAVIF